ncbi:MAG TPA: AtpZ/AtpI family protein [Flavobacteriaceae bacterium]|nr:AtpZ/AtpI family protein [Flavobacteriaceae bacterium]
MSEKRNQDPSKKQNQLRRYLQLSGIGIQMGATIFLFSLGGRKLDEYFKPEKDWFTIISVLIGVFVAVFMVIKQLNSLNKKN